MNVLTHALLPALLAAPLLPQTTPRVFYVSGGIVALAGALPDLLTPHLSLAARYASWSHTVFAWAGFNILLIGLGIALRRRGHAAAGGVGHLPGGLAMDFRGVHDSCRYLGRDLLVVVPRQSARSPQRERG